MSTEFDPTSATFDLAAPVWFRKSIDVGCFYVQFRSWGQSVAEACQTVEELISDAGGIDRINLEAERRDSPDKAA